MLDPAQASKTQATTNSHGPSAAAAATTGGAHDVQAAGATAGTTAGTAAGTTAGATAADSAPLRVVLDGEAVRVVSPNKATPAQVGGPATAAGAAEAGAAGQTAGGAAGMADGQLVASPHDRLQQLLPSRPGSPLLGLGSLTESPLGAVLLGTPNNMGGTGPLIGTEPTPPPPLLPMQHTGKLASLTGGVTGDGAASGQLAQRLGGDGYAQQGWQMARQEGEAGAAAAGAGQAMPNSVPVMCGENKGSFILRTREIACHCTACSQVRARAEMLTCLGMKDEA